MSDHRLHGFEIGIGGAVDVGEDVARVEDVESFVLHRAHGEILCGHDVEHVEVVATAKAMLVPAHRTQGRRQGELAARRIAGFAPDIDRHGAPFRRREGGADVIHTTCSNGEQVAGFGKGIVPAGAMLAVAE